MTRNVVKKVYSFLEILPEHPELGAIKNEEKGIRGFTKVKEIDLFYNSMLSHKMAHAKILTKNSPFKHSGKKVCRKIIVHSMICNHREKNAPRNNTLLCGVYSSNMACNAQ